MIKLVNGLTATASVFAFALSGFAGRVTAADDHAGGAANGSGVAVVELFTSQGCSSCPPAEAVVGSLNAAAQQSHQAIYTLAFHVDYWDHLGWRDPFSDARFSARQYVYSRTLHLEQVYTPQMIVNGRTEFLGSDNAMAVQATQAALAKPAETPMTINATANPTGGGSRIRFAVAGVTEGSVVDVAVVEQGLSTEVKRGENADRHLDQPSVVRWFTSIPAGAAGEVEIPRLLDVRAGHATVVAFVQRREDGTISGAAATALPSPVVSPH